MNDNICRAKSIRKNGQQKLQLALQHCCDELNSDVERFTTNKKQVVI